MRRSAAVAFSLVAQAVQALVDRAVLGVDRHDLCAWGSQRPLHHRAGRDQRLLIGQGEAASSLQRTRVTGSPAKPTTPFRTMSASSAIAARAPSPARTSVP